MSTTMNFRPSAANPRQANMELLRIVAMFLVIAVHSSFKALGAPTKDSIMTDPIGEITKISVESITIICVNLFVLISGWFGIKPKVRGILKFGFQVAFFLYGTYAISVLTGIAHPGAVTFIMTLTASQAWFVPAYLVLYLFSPLINSWLEKSSKNQIRNFLICFYILQTVYNYIPGSMPSFFVSGYSALSFIGLYVLARYLRNHIKLSLPKCLMGGVLCVLINIMVYILTTFCAPSLASRYFTYSNPIIVIQSCLVFLVFTRIRLKENKAVNYVAASAFSVYLLNSAEGSNYYFYDNVRRLADGPMPVLTIFIFLIGFFLTAVVIDQIRKYLWLKITKN